MKKSILKIITFFVVLLFPIIYCSAIKGHDLNEEWPGYHCYIMAYDADATEYYNLFTFREIEGMSNKVVVDNPNSQCLDSSYQGRVPILGPGRCEVNLWSIVGPLDESSDSEHDGACHDNTCYYLTYSHWKHNVTQASMYSSYPTDCIAGSMMAYNIDGNHIYPVLYIEAGKNSDFYDEEEMEFIKNNYSNQFDDDTNFCFVKKNGQGNGDVMFYFGHPFRVYNYMDDDGGGYSKVIIPDEGDMGNLGGGFINTDIFDDVSSSQEDGDLIVELFPSAYSVKNIDGIKEYFNENIDHTGESFILVGAADKLITDQSECLSATKEYLNTVYSSWAYSEDNIAGIAQNTLTDTTIENEDRNRDIADFQELLDFGYTKTTAINMCSSPVESEWTTEPKCYKFTHLPSIGKPMYNTTVWTNKPLSCGFEATEWTFQECRDAKLNHIHKECKDVDNSGDNTVCYNITNTGYNGMADFFIKVSNPEAELACQDLYGLHIIYRVITIAAPILVVFFVTFDFVKSIIIGDPKKIAKVREKSIRRLIAVAILFLLPLIISMLVNSLSKNGKLRDDSLLKCVVKGKK